MEFRENTIDVCHK